MVTSTPIAVGGPAVRNIPTFVNAIAPAAAAIVAADATTMADVPGPSPPPPNRPGTLPAAGRHGGRR